MILMEELERNYKIWMPNHKELHMKKPHKSILIASMISIRWVCFLETGEESSKMLQMMVGCNASLIQTPTLIRTPTFGCKALVQYYLKTNTFSVIPKITKNDTSLVGIAKKSKINAQHPLLGISI